MRLVDAHGGWRRLLVKIGRGAIAGMAISILMVWGTMAAAQRYVGGRMLDDGAGGWWNVATWTLVLIGFLLVNRRWKGRYKPLLLPVLYGQALLMIVGMVGGHFSARGFVGYWLAVAVVAVLAEPVLFRAERTSRIPQALRVAVEQRAAWVQTAMASLSPGLSHQLQQFLAEALMTRLMRSIWRDNHLALPEMEVLHELARLPGLAREVVGEPTDALAQARYRAMIDALLDDWDRRFRRR